MYRRTKRVSSLRLPPSLYFSFSLQCQNNIRLRPLLSGNENRIIKPIFVLLSSRSGVCSPPPSVFLHLWSSTPVTLGRLSDGWCDGVHWSLSIFKYTVYWFIILHTMFIKCYPSRQSEMFPRYPGIFLSTLTDP